MSHKKIYSAAVIVIGNEILTGRTQDANTQYIATRLTEHGIRLQEVRVVPDSENKIAGAVNEMRIQYDYVFTTGGIGPTHDDITADSIAAAFGVGIDVHPEAREILLQHYGQENLNDARLRMARIPHGAKLIQNPVSAAPGFVVDNVYVMAGVPQIMRAMMDLVITGLQGGDPVISASVSCGLPESAVAEDMRKLQGDYPELEIGSYPYFRNGEQGLSIVIRGSERQILEDAVDKMVSILHQRGENPLKNFSG